MSCCALLSLSAARPHSIPTFIAASMPVKGGEKP